MIDGVINSVSGVILHSFVNFQTLTIIKPIYMGALHTPTMKIFTNGLFKANHLPNRSVQNAL
ncbi:hypothetical protein NKT77_10165 [Moraxella sp. FZLJ2107]|uniref:hypothetical protein n=1 Tax=unclassified Moraxella TaxID=2685852 RepID=UPI0020C89817|nr:MULTISPECIES: hypothetical protein [unclassified Moraxella]UTO04853.1 hypothetical protein NKT77_10165 [Moraxella sp. FZLJ2107]UTO21587.1 hypothetical protein NKU06_06980 [Moraxella sp. FZLJ2109]